MVPCGCSLHCDSISSPLFLCLGCGPRFCELVRILACLTPAPWMSPIYTIFGLRLHRQRAFFSTCEHQPQASTSVSPFQPFFPLHKNPHFPKSSDSVLQYPFLGPPFRTIFFSQFHPGRPATDYHVQPFFSFPSVPPKRHFCRPIFLNNLPLHLPLLVSFGPFCRLLVCFSPYLINCRFAFCFPEISTPSPCFGGGRPTFRLPSGVVICRRQCSP